MQFRVISQGVDPLTVVFEPVGMETILRSGDYITVEWGGDEPGEIVHRPEYLEIGDPVGGVGLTRAWNSSGEEIPILG